MAAAAFSIRGYAASMRGEAAAEGRRPLGIEHLPPIKAPRFRWWADELASAVAAAAPAASPRRSPGKSKPPKKRSISDLFAAAPPLDIPSAPAGDSGCNEQTEVDGDEALCAIVRRAKEQKKQKRRLQEEQEETAAAAAPESSGGRDPEGNFAATKKPEASQRRRKERENISGSRKKAKINNAKKKADTKKCIDNSKAGKVGKPRDLGKSLPRQGILKYTEHTSVKMANEKHVNSKGHEVIELCCKSVKGVKFSEADGVIGSKTQSCELPKQQSLCKLFSDAMASSSFSSSTSSTSIEGDKCVTAETSSSDMPNKAFAKTKEANKHCDNKYSAEPSNREMSAPFIDLNMTPPECTDLGCTYDSNLEVPNLEHRHDETLSSDAELLAGGENLMNLSFGSQGLESQPPASDFEKIKSSRWAGTFLNGEAINVSDIDAVGSPLSLRELAETRWGCSNVSVNDTMTMSTYPCALPDQTFQDSFTQHKTWFSRNLNNVGSQLSRECNVSHSTELYSRSELNVGHECSPSTGQTVRLMGKDLTVCTTRGESFAETAQKHTGTSTNDYLKANVLLPQGQPFFSLQAQSFPNVAVNSTRTTQASTYHASTSHAHFGYRTPHDFSHPFPAANIFSGDRLPYESRYGGFSNSRTNQTFLLGCPPLPNHSSAAFHQNTPRPWRYFSDPFAGDEPPAAPFLPVTGQQRTPPSVFHADLPRQHVVHSARSSVCPLNSVSYTLSHPGQVIQEVSNSTGDAALLSRNTENRMRRAVPDNSNASSSCRSVQKRSGPVKLTPGVKHILVPSDSTHGDSMPVYSCLSFGSRSGNAAGSQNKGA
ncbi:uncharacterized protein LOC119267476 isoform X2 [Triticum dicoccoides]|uniref:Uncharacterized protein n=1 Tax=Triticum turgidum subsp. durum TaxID=4567 RepID=A0A9R0RE16_TRITD|nr:uncharacterized protein LOC119267476 isoform X2 [Triticum dicoccoides]VAH58738.1 unnamed protein product [Triticum turgidum subsp. durum]